MNLDLLWVADPKTKEGSISLTLLMITFAAALIACGLEIAGVIKSTSSMVELFYANAGLYFGRRLNIGAKSFGSEPTEKKE
jgi:hypothetical protein